MNPFKKLHEEFNNMVEDKEKNLFNKYPKIFKNMENGCFRISTSIPDGWIKIVDDLCGAIQTYIDNINNNNKHLPQVPQVVVDQVKEKFGGLRFYYHGGNKQIEGMVDMAEYMSYKTCMFCGKDGKLKGNNWVITTCDECDKE